MNVVLTLGRSAPAGSDAVYLDFKRHEVSRGRERARLWPTPFLVAAAIICAQGPLTTTELVDGIYGDREDGGPEFADKVVHVATWHARQRLSPLGLSLCSHKGYLGYLVIDLWAAPGALAA